MSAHENQTLLSFDLLHIYSDECDYGCVWANSRFIDHGMEVRLSELEEKILDNLYIDWHAMNLDDLPFDADKKYAIMQTKDFNQLVDHFDDVDLMDY